MHKIGDKVNVTKGERAFGPHGNHFVISRDESDPIWTIEYVNEYFVILTRMNAWYHDCIHRVCVFPGSISAIKSEADLKREALMKKASDLEIQSQELKTKISEIRTEIGKL